MAEKKVSKTPFEKDAELPEEPKLTRKSRWLKILTYIMVILLIIIIPCTYYFFNKEWGYEIPEYNFSTSDVFDINNYSSVIAEENEFKILQVTDLHLLYGGWPGDNRTIALLRDMIIYTEPDLIVFTGDIAFTIFNSRMAERLVYVMKEFNIPYTVALGNHDCWGKGTKRKIANIYHDAELCIFPYGPTNIALEPGILSVGNFPIFIKNAEGDIRFSIVCMDTGEKYQGDYAYISEKQKEWYIWLMDGIEQSMPGLPGLTFIHIPLFEITLVPPENFTGTPNERFSKQGKNMGMADEMLKYNVLAVFWGHDHTNDYIADYVNPEISGNILKLVGTRSSGYNAYGRWGFDKGGRLITVDLDNGEIVSMPAITSSMVYA